MTSIRAGLWLLAVLLATGCAETRAVDQDRDWVLTITSPKSNWATREAIVVTAELRYVGPGAGTEFFGSGSGPLFFDFSEVGGTRVLGGGGHSDCKRYEIQADAPLVMPYRKSGGWTAEDPNAVFYRGFIADPLLHLPLGEWEVGVRAGFSMPPGCSGRSVSLRASVVLTVE